jgi:AcrR family transcriptional regulator
LTDAAQKAYPPPVSMRLDLYHHFGDEERALLEQIAQRLERVERIARGTRKTLTQEDEAMRQDIAELASKVAQGTTVEQSVVTLVGQVAAVVNDLVGKLGEGSVDPADVQAIAAQVTAQMQALQQGADILAAAVVAGTSATPAPAAPPPNPEPVPGEGQGGEPGGGTVAAPLPDVAPGSSIPGE